MRCLLIHTDSVLRKPAKNRGVLYHFKKSGCFFDTAVYNKNKFILKVKTAFMDYIPNPEALYMGTVVKIMNHGMNGFIRMNTGHEVYFNRQSRGYGMDPLRVGELVICKIHQRPHPKKDADEYYAVELIRSADM